ncbi:uncharacterized protein LOC111794081 isoform X2 [Cucurbita pepo subsp. pepo]|uniref:uncharacterized protein LOC111794081 isoform X2 n=1 Tax=Cucurbita pepo subsp. pepo TaxID=3664 RepID=UPI000C9D3593|nr:uncharacterized protein LOC111794081 isoform X2 [Cucurbita pepo subsp. pepo]
MAVLSSLPLCAWRHHRPSSSSSSSSSHSWLSFFSSNSFSFPTTQLPVPATCFPCPPPIRVSNVSTHQRTITVDKSKLRVSEATSKDELWAAACLRVRTFNQFRPDSYDIDFSDDGEDRVVVGSLDLNQCIRLPDEIAGMKPEGIGADFARAYLSNVCVAKEVHRNGLGFALVAKAKTIAEDWGISDLYVHVAFDNEPAKNLYLKSGFVHESDEPAWQARFLDRPRRILLWTTLSELL